MNIHFFRANTYRPIILIMVYMCFSFLSNAQLVNVQTFYDFNKKQLKENFYVLKKNNQVRDSSYTSYFQNKQKKIAGTYKKGLAEGLWSFYYENGNLKMEGVMVAGEKDGVWKYYYENGIISMEGQSVAGDRTGLWKYYYENGKTRSEGKYSENKKNGAWSYYYEDGALKALASYEDDNGDYLEMYPSGKIKASGRIEDSKSVGEWSYYHEDGTLMAVGNEVDGLKSGVWKYYHPNGQIASEGLYVNGKNSGPWKYYHDNGVLSAVGNMENGEKDGAWKIYYNSGLFKGETNYVNGQGTYKEYYEGGALRTEGTIINDKHEGVWNYYLENGVLEGTCNYTRGEGLYKGFYLNGKPKMEGKLINGNKVGVWTLYNEDGTVAGYYKTFYENQAPKLITDTTQVLVTKDTLASSIKPKYVTPKKKSRYFTPRVNEVRAFIVSSNPLYMLASSFPVSVEYYLQERLGYEIGGVFLYKPMFNSHAKIPTNTVYSKGAELYVRQKFYRRDKDYGMLYMAQELRYGYSVYENNFIDFTAPVAGAPEHMQQVQQTIEYSILFGDRIMIDQRKKGWTFDIYGGIGLGYRNVTTNWTGSDIEYGAVFPGVSRSPVSIPFRFGFTVGYKFPKK
ncbi:conserved hypothetical protein [Cytophaga hutchinsonii ATCC 33406]|uniref:Uncharacterized protein n=2 Tax=Cytophaga hutchinsonii TaxID=985 RepID=A0A6N4SQX8_CYTH3|nr:conserved hypothetical protein [Cytophaga hutchinsonii ATCC 33406]